MHTATVRVRGPGGTLVVSLLLAKQREARTEQEHPQALFVSYTSLLGGAERILLDRTCALDGPATLACPDGELRERARELGLATVGLRERRLELRGRVRDRVGAPVRLAAQSMELRAIIARLTPRCVVGWSMRGLLVSAAALSGRRPRPPLVFAQNDFPPSANVARAVRIAAGRAERVVALSHAIAADTDPHGRLAIEVIHPGVDLERFAPSPLPEGSPVALVLGAIIGWKRPDLALEAAALAANDVPDLQVRFAGAPLGEAGEQLLARLRERAAKPDLVGRVSFDGASIDAPTALREATCLLHCADREPFGVALTEALACGRPVAAPAAGGPLEILDAKSGVLYPVGDARAAAAALVTTVRCAPEFSAPARARAERLFDAPTARGRFRAVIEEVAG